jgi:hypothetical protein
MAKSEAERSKWFDTVAAIATRIGNGKRYDANDVRVIMKAWRVDYQSKKAGEDAELKSLREMIKSGKVRLVGEDGKPITK